MVKWSEISPFLHKRAESLHEAAAVTGTNLRGRLIGEGTEDAMTCKEQHARSSALLGVIMQVDTFLAGFLLFSLTGERNTDDLEPDEKVQVVLQTVTFGVFLAAIIHTALLMMSTGWKYTLNWYDPIWPGITSAVGLGLLLVTVADAVLIEVRPDTDLDDPDYWYIVILGLLLPVVLSGLIVTVQMCRART